MSAPPLTLRFEGGTLVLQGLASGLQLPPALWDPRIHAHRAPAYRYPELLNALAQAGLAVDDQARADVALTLALRSQRQPFDHQAQALACWKEAGRRGVVVLPTGAGKTFVAVLAIADAQRTALVVVPTLDLMAQWYDLLGAAFDTEIGLVGGGHHVLCDLTVTTYDSAHLHMDRLGARFGLIVFDECHHLPSPMYLTAAESSLAPFRLGLTATLERPDGKQALLHDRVGKVVFARSIGELAGLHLAEYETVRLGVALTPDERVRYQEARGLYRAFLRDQGIVVSSPEGWGRFIMRASQSAVGRRAFAAYRAQKQLATAPVGKLKLLEGLLRQHASDRVLVFTQDNETVHAISRRFLIPAITHQTDLKERKALLQGFGTGEYAALVTSRVLNEGVDLPDANVAVVLSGSGSVREHVQRLGRILRRREGKRAVLYEVVTSETGEEHTSARRREHEAYR
jgi:superfamily II DNA or RNA helicase